jgi:cellulose synthase/poly-beta-1,6-N-acetylglucosamine synthase-like glycosyltransferase
VRACGAATWAGPSLSSLLRSRWVYVAALAAPAVALALLLRRDAGRSFVVVGVAIAVAVMLGLLALRRLVLLTAAVLPASRSVAMDASTPSLTVVLAAHNEAPVVGRALAAIERLEYPAERLHVVVVDDGSKDGTGDLLERWAARHQRAKAVRLEQREGKSGALNAALRVAPATDLVAVCDADHELHPDFLRLVVSSFADEAVGAAGAFLRPVNANASMVARYAAVEAWVTQLVTSAARSRLDLNPPMLGGGSVYRRQALDQIGGFSPGLAGEDARVSIALTRNGWRTRFVRDAVVDNTVVEDWRHYWDQHVRWARTGYETVGLQRGGSSVPPGRKLEAWMVSAGYSDRVVLLAAIGLSAADALPLWVPLAYVGMIVATVVVAIVRGGATRRLPLYLLATAVLLPLDAAATVVSGAHQLSRRPLHWRTPRPAGGDGPIDHT